MKKCMFIFIMTMVMDSIAYGLSDNFEDGVIDTSMWAVGGEKRSYLQMPAGSWDCSHEEIMDTDGYLRTRVWGPTSGVTYGHDAWIRTKHDFNDGKSYLVNFTWEAEVVGEGWVDFYFIQITDGYTPANANYNWPIANPPVGTTDLLWHDSGGNPVNCWTLLGGMAKTSMSIKITPDGTARLYDGPNGSGNLLHQGSLNPNVEWYIRFMVSDATSAGHPGGDSRINLYDFSATEETTDIEKFNACSAGMLCLYNLVAAIPYYGLPGEAAVVACRVKELVESDDIGQALAKNLILQIIVFDMIEEVAPIQVVDIAQAGYSCLVEFLILEILPCDNFTWKCIKQEWPELVEEFLIFPGPILAIIPRSPVDIKIYDSQGNVMELNTEGYTDNGLSSPGWIFKGPNHQELAIILEADDEYLFEVVGTEGGTYGLDIASVSGGEEITFEAADITTSPGARHVYAVDWQALSTGGEGVILEIDNNGDGFFEQMAIADNELSYDEFALQTETVVDFDPDTLNLKSKGKFATVYIELPDDFDVSEIDISSLTLNELVPALPKPIGIGDYDSDGINDLMVKFDLQELIEVLEPGEQIIDLTGQLLDGRRIAGFDFIRVIH